MGIDDLADGQIPTKLSEATKARRARLGTTTTTTPRIKGEFLRGPIPLSWLSIASKTDDIAAVQAALAIWWEAGRKGSNKVRLTNENLARFQVGGRRRKYHGLQILADAGLISVEQEAGKNPVVTLLNAGF